MAKAKLKTQENIPKGLYGLIENLPLTESDKKRAHIIRMLGDLVAHWATDVKTRRSADILEVVLTSRLKSSVFSLLLNLNIPKEYVNVADERFLFTELIATEAYNNLIHTAAILFPG